MSNNSVEFTVSINRKIVSGLKMERGQSIDFVLPAPEYTLYIDRIYTFSLEL
jgi:hypothetical protein